MKPVAIIFIAIIFYGCFTSAKVEGKYASDSNPDYFKFNFDSTFDYVYRAFHKTEYSSGKWKLINRKTLELNSLIQNKELPLKIRWDIDTFRVMSYLKIKFETSEDLKKYKCVIFINDTLYHLKENGLITPTGLNLKEFKAELNLNDMYFRYQNCDSLSSIKLTGFIRSIFLIIIKLENNSTSQIGTPLQSEKYFASPESKHTSLGLTISINDSLFNYHIFKNEKIKLRPNELLFFNNNTKTWWHVPKQEN